MDDEEHSYATLQEPLYRVETGNYEYRLILRCRQEARKQFARLRADVLVKIELLDNKHVQDTVIQLQKFVSAISQFHTQCYDVVQGARVFPIEVDLFEKTFNYNPSGQINEVDDADYIEHETAGAATGALGNSQPASNEHHLGDLLNLG